MSQQIDLNLDPDHVPLSSISKQERAKTIIADSSRIELCLLPKGTREGRSVVGVFARLPDGRPVYLEITARNFMSAAKVFEARLAQMGEWL